jgi:AraC-like DNA-binding protein
MIAASGIANPGSSRMTQGPELQPASKLFAFDERAADSPYVEKYYRTHSIPRDAFISTAYPRWEMVVTRVGDSRLYLTIRGPVTRASAVAIPQQAEFFGIQFSLGTFMPGLRGEHLVDAWFTPRGVGGRSFWLDGSAWEFPNFDNADVFVQRLIRKGVLERDPLVVAATQGHLNDLSLRSVQRRILRTTGLTHVAIRQMERAQRAVELLDRGVSILDTVELTGYSDQAHLTRSLNRLMGQTPTQIVAASS